MCSIIILNIFVWNYAFWMKKCNEVAMASHSECLYGPISHEFEINIDSGQMYDSWLQK
jgi:hypothetical protein